MSAAEKLEEHRQKKAHEYMGLADSALQGVTVAFLAQVFRLTPFEVKRRIVNCPIKETRKRGSKQVQHLYDLAEAARYLVQPITSTEDLLKNLKREDLPPAISTAYWDAQLKRQKWEENAGELWRTDTIRGIIGGMFQTIKFTIQLWGDTLERQVGLTEEQREILNTATDELQTDMFAAFQENAKESMTGPQLSELEYMLNEAKETDEEEDDDDGSDLI